MTISWAFLKVHAELMVEHIYLFSRLLLADSRLFLQLMAAAALVLNNPETKLYDLLLDRWWGKVSSDPVFHCSAANILSSVRLDQSTSL